MKVKLGQVWEDNSLASSRVLITELILYSGRLGNYEVRAVKLRGTTASNFGEVDRNYEPINWFPSWKMINQTTKVRTGQTWQDVTGRTHTISDIQGNTAISDGCVYGILFFGYSLDWVSTLVETNAPIQSVVAAKPNVSNNADFEFFKAPTQAGHCVCRIPKERCDYHR